MGLVPENRAAVTNLPGTKSGNSGGLEDERRVLKVILTSSEVDSVTRDWGGHATDRRKARALPRAL